MTAYHFPGPWLLSDRVPLRVIKENSHRIQQFLLSNGIEAAVRFASRGPVVTSYDIKIIEGDAPDQISPLKGELSAFLTVSGSRIVKSFRKPMFRLEVPNKYRETIHLEKIIINRKFWGDPELILGLAIGKGTDGMPVVIDLTTMPHILMAGAAGSGKSVSLHTMILSLLFRHSPDDLKLFLIDPNGGEFADYEGLPHLLFPIVKSPTDAIQALKWVREEMDRRYSLLAAAGVREIKYYNDAVGKPPGEGDEDLHTQVFSRLPYIVVIIDEISDLMMLAPNEVESYLVPLSQMARAVGIHLVIATQRLTSEVLPINVKANIPARISLKLTSQTDSKFIIDADDADCLVGKGDMLFFGPGYNSVLRIHGAFVSKSGIQRVVEYIKSEK